MSGDGGHLAERLRLRSAVRLTIRALIWAFPGVAWVKRYDKGNEVYVFFAWSRGYVEKVVGEAIKEYANKDDFQFWPPTVAQEFFNNDEAARKGKGVSVREFFESHLTGVRGHFEGWKWSFSIFGEVYVAGLGEIIPEVQSDE